MALEFILLRYISLWNFHSEDGLFFPFLNIPFIAVPYPHATDNHQFLNAKRYFDLNCCWILEEKNFNSGDIYKIISQIMTNKNQYFEKKNNLKKIFKNKSYEKLNKKLINYFNEN